MKNDIFKNPKTYTISTLILGYLLIGDMTPLEQNAIGNWLMTLGQILEANCAFEQLINGNVSLNNKDQLLNSINSEDIDNIKDILNKLLDKLNNIKKQ